ncbi:hypothetical protein BpHYR1_043146 [Brachionus plicatilis]|uniref:Uncharacterized protein n=1 Tax=Brachionus plicatilis TaxID=10195 RepID=A0A3M7R134_BRAPC|nr:hypothetical protein BpHYR1_043146 [Brachionus plicatilis]
MPSNLFLNSYKKSLRNFKHMKKLSKTDLFMAFQISSKNKKIQFSTITQNQLNILLSESKSKLDIDDNLKSFIGNMHNYFIQSVIIFDKIPFIF